MKNYKNTNETQIQYLGQSMAYLALEIQSNALQFQRDGELHDKADLRVSRIKSSVELLYKLKNLLHLLADECGSECKKELMSYEKESQSKWRL